MHSVGARVISSFGPAYVKAALAFTNDWFTTNRSALGDQLAASFDGQSSGGRVEGGQCVLKGLSDEELDRYFNHNLHIEDTQHVRTRARWWPGPRDWFGDDDGGEGDDKHIEEFEAA